MDPFFLPVASLSATAEGGQPEKAFHFAKYTFSFACLPNGAGQLESNGTIGLNKLRHARRVEDLMVLIDTKRY
jgi:hypothetical protein